MTRFTDTDVHITRERGLRALASGGAYIRESSWPFDSPIHFGAKRLWWLVLEDADGYEDEFDTFCELWNHARDFREVGQ